MTEKQKKLIQPFYLLFQAACSLRLTAALLLYLAAACALSTFVPQGMPPDAYFAAYSQKSAAFILAAGFDHFFTSYLFLAAVCLFFVNLTACTVSRFVRELRKPSGRNFAPDILHGGLILLMIASLLSVVYRRQGIIVLTEGDSVALPGGGELRLEKFEYFQHNDGRPLDWISYISATENGKIILPTRPLRVNHPVKLKGITFYQYSYIQTPNGAQYTVLQAASDPAYAFVVVSFALCGTGLAAVAYGKIRKKPRKKL